MEGQCWVVGVERHKGDRGRRLSFVVAAVNVLVEADQRGGRAVKLLGRSGAHCRKRSNQSQRHVTSPCSRCLVDHAE